MNYGPDIVAPRLNFADINTEAIGKGIDNARATHDKTLASYAMANEDILKDDTLHPEERSKRLQRLEDSVFKDIGSFGGNIAQASDSIINRIIEERKDPFYNMDKQYTDVYKTAQQNRSRLEVSGKSAFMRGADGREISEPPTLFNPDGTMKSRQDFQFDYEGILDYNAAAEKMFDNVVANVSTVAPQLANNVKSEELVKLVGDFMKYGTVESTVLNINRILAKAVEPFMQTPEYDQMKRRGVEGSMDAILQRAGEERKYTKNNITHKLLNDVLGRPAGSGSTDPLIQIDPLNAIEIPIIGTEEEAQVTNKAVDKVSDKVSARFKNLLLDSQYGNVKFSYKGNKLVPPKVVLGGNKIDLPLTGSRATSILSDLNDEIPALKSELERLLVSNNLGSLVTAANSEISAFESELNSVLKSQGVEIPALYDEILDMKKWLDDSKILQRDLTRNKGNLDKAEKDFLTEYGLVANNLIENGFASDTQDAMMFVENYNINRSLQSRKMYDTNSINLGDDANKALVDVFAKLASTNGVGVISMPEKNKGSVKLDEDEKIQVMTPEGKEADGTKFNWQGSTPVIGSSSKIYLDPKLKTIILDDKYAIDPTDFKNFNAVLAPVLNLVGAVEGLADLSDATVKTPKRLLTEKGARPVPININGNTYHIPTNALAYTFIEKTSDGADIVVNIVDPNNPNRVMKFKYNDFKDATGKAAIGSIAEHLIPKTVYGAQFKKLDDAQKIVPEYM